MYSSKKRAGGISNGSCRLPRDSVKSGEVLPILYGARADAARPSLIPRRNPGLRGGDVFLPPRAGQACLLRQLSKTTTSRLPCLPSTSSSPHPTNTPCCLCLRHTSSSYRTPNRLVELFTTPPHTIDTPPLHKQLRTQQHQHYDSLLQPGMSSLPPMEAPGRYRSRMPLCSGASLPAISAPRYIAHVLTFILLPGVPPPGDGDAHLPRPDRAAALHLAPQALHLHL